MEPNQQEIDKWLSDMHELETSIAEYKRSRNYYEGKRKKASTKLKVLMQADPRQTKLEIWL